MALSHNLGFPRIGAKRELKQALESYWRGDIDAEQLETAGASLRRRHWVLQKEAGIQFIPVGDFSFYDQVLDMSVLLGALPQRFEAGAGTSDFPAYFAMARGTTTQPALEMTKWFDTNYHYLVPELHADMQFGIASERLFAQVSEAQRLGVRAKPVLLGPLSFLYLAKTKGGDFDRLDLLDGLLAVYAQILKRLNEQGVEWVQIDEPALALDLPAQWIAALDSIYATLGSKKEPKVLLCTYFESVAEHSERLKRLPIAGLHLDLARAPQQLDAFLPNYPEDKILSLGVVDGRNIWRSDLERALDLLEPVQQRLGDRLWVAPSCSLLHSPIDLQAERKLAPELRSWMAFGVQKLSEIATLVRGLNDGRTAIAEALSASKEIRLQRLNSERIHDPAVKQRLAALSTADAKRQNPFAVRQAKQRLRFDLPAFPTTTIGSFPQTAEIRAARAAYKRGELGAEAYTDAMKKEIAQVVRKQEEIGLDVLVHGEAERNDMVEYFGEQLRGFAFSEHGWVQSYGSRCVKPPIIFGDVSRPGPMTVEWFEHAQSLTPKPMKGMLTGPVTMLQWSFVRDDQPRALTTRQIALAIRDEVRDLEAAGAGMIQIDEPAFREGLPLKASAWPEYLEWAVEAFRLASAGVRDETQIHTHMCYAEFNDILPAIAALDADVITIETSRSDMELLRGFGNFRYPNEIGPGVYDIHSPRVPEAETMSALLRKACAVIEPPRLWVNPDCGLKTRGWPEVELALRRMVAAAQALRAAS